MKIDITTRGLWYLLITVGTCYVVYLATLNVGYYWGFEEGEENVVCTPWIPDKEYFESIEKYQVYQSLYEVEKERADKAELALLNECGPILEEQKTIYKQAEVIRKLRTQCQEYHAEAKIREENAKGVDGLPVWHEYMAMFYELCNQKHPLPENL